MNPDTWQADVKNRGGAIVRWPRKTMTVLGVDVPDPHYGELAGRFGPSAQYGTPIGHAGYRYELAPWLLRASDDADAFGQSVLGDVSGALNDLGTFPGQVVQAAVHTLADNAKVAAGADPNDPNSDTPGILDALAALLGVPKWFIVSLLVFGGYAAATAAGLTPPISKVFKK